MTGDGPWRAVLDGNAVDYFMSIPNAFEFLREGRDAGRIDLLFTHDVVEEILNDDEDREAAIVRLLHLLSYARMVASGAFIVGYSRVGMSRILGDTEPFNTWRPPHDDGTGKKNNTRDAIVIATARYEDCLAISNDKRLRGRANRNGVEAITPDEALFRMGFPGGDLVSGSHPRAIINT